MLYREAVEPNTLELLRELSQIPYLVKLRLVGGTALALQINHRKSIDLDFFGSMRLNDEELSNSLTSYPDRWLMSKSPNIYVYNINGIKVDFVRYQYDWIDDVVREEGIRMEGLKDIAAMKINAITGRGTKKDFVDLFFLLQRFDLNEILDFYLEKFKDGNLFLALRSLTYFDDADSGQVEMIVQKYSWKEMKHYILDKYSKYLADNHLR